LIVVVVVIIAGIVIITASKVRMMSIEDVFPLIFLKEYMF
jgi:hypothetical protein